MSDFFREAVMIERLSKVLGSNTRIYEQDLYDSDLGYFWKSLSLSAVQMRTEQIQSAKEKVEKLEIETEIRQQKPIEISVREQESKSEIIEEKEWKKLEQKVQSISKSESSGGSIDTYLQEFNRLKDDVNAEIVILSSLYRQEPTASKKQAIAEKIKILKSYRSSGDPNALVDYIILKLGISKEDGERFRKKVLETRESTSQQNLTDNKPYSTSSFEPYAVIFSTMEKMSSSSLLLYLMKFDPEIFKKYSLKQIDESQALHRAKQIYLKQKGVPESVIQEYLKDSKG